MKRTKKAAAKVRSASGAKKSKRVSPVPAGYHTVTAALAVRDGAKAIEFYKKAFGAKEIARMLAPDGSLAHAEIRIGDSRIMMGDEMPAMGATAPPTVGGSPVTICLYVPEVDKLFNQAVKAGATVTMPLADMFWGDRYGKLTDPFGHKWALAMHIEDMSPKEMERRGAKAMAEMAEMAKQK